MGVVPLDFQRFDLIDALEPQLGRQVVAGKVNILGMVLREALALLTVGLVAGIALALAAGSAARAMFFGLKPADPWTLFLAAGSLAIVAITASVLPAVRATAVDPMQALREE